MSSCGGAERYCSDASDYPDTLTRNLLSRQEALRGKLFKQVFDAECSDLRAGIIGTRFFSVEDEQLCSGRHKVIFPRKALNLNNEWRFVVNVDNFTQAVDIEECEEPFFSDFNSDSYGSCLYAGGQGKNPSVTACKQIYSEYKLLSLASNQLSLEVDKFRLPSACACYITESGGGGFEFSVK